jgi:hypothetical protein
MHRKMIKLVDSHPRTFDYNKGHRWNRRGVPPTPEGVLANFGLR